MSRRIKLHTFHFLFRLFAYLADKSGGWRVFVRPKLLLGSLIVGLGLIPQLLGWLAINQALGHIRPTVASVSLLSQTVFTAIFSILILGEVLTLHEIGGALVVLVGIYLVNRK